MMEQNQTGPNTVQQLMYSVYPAIAMHAGMRLELFTPLADGPLTADELAEKLGVSAYRLRPLLYALVVAELLTVDGEHFSNTPTAAHYLVKGQGDYLGGIDDTLHRLWTTCLMTADTIREGAPQAKYDFAAEPFDVQLTFFKGLHPRTLLAGRALAQRYDFSSAQTLIDIAAGSGGMGIGIAEVVPGLHVTAADLPSVTPITQTFIDDAGIGDRVQVQSVNMVEAAPAGEYDLAVARAFTQVLSAEDAQKALKNIAGAVKPGGWVYLVCRVVDDSRVAPLDTVASNLIFLNMYDHGEAYTESEYRAWLAEAGFIDVERYAPPFGDSVIRAQKPA